MKVKAVDVKLRAYINFVKEYNYKDPKFKVDDYVEISKSFFGTKKLLLLKKFKILGHGHI